MAQRLSIGLFADAVYRPLHGLARRVSAALAVAIVVVGLLATVATPPLVRLSSTLMESARLQPSAAAVASQGLIRDRASRANDDDYLEGLIKVLDHDP
jgi:hypothetical protein